MSLVKSSPAFDAMMEASRMDLDNSHELYLEAQYLSMTRPHRERFLVDDEQPEHKPAADVAQHQPK